MSTPSGAAPGLPMHAEGIAPAVMQPAHPMLWSVRRELWENRYAVITPFVVSALILFGFAISAIGLPHRRRAVMLLGDAKARAAITQPYDVDAMILIATAFLLGVFYCLDALHGERRDRSILFWKSMPVSDATTVLAKASIPMAVLPALTFCVIVMTQMVMLLHTSVLLLASGMSPASTFHYFNIVQQSLILLYGLTVIAVWHAPIYAWILLVSAWARRAVLLWCVLPFFAIGIVEKIAFNTGYLPALLRWRFFGGIEKAFVIPREGTMDLPRLTPGTFLATPGLWIGLVFAAACLAAAARLRRNREPI